jgi:transcriptional regulator NrdR family protein
MLTVIKRSGKEEAFSPDKIKNTLAAASDEMGRPLNAGDLRILVSSVESRLSGREKISSREVLMTLIDLLREEGYSDLAGRYVGYVTNQWH